MNCLLRWKNIIRDYLKELTALEKDDGGNSSTNKFSTFIKIID